MLSWVKYQESRRPLAMFLMPQLVGILLVEVTPAARDSGGTPMGYTTPWRCQENDYPEEPHECSHQNQQ